MVVMIITLSLQTCVSGAHGASGRRARTRVAVGSGSATGGPWPLHQALAARASRRRARAATRDSAQVRPLTSSHFVRFRRAVTKTLGVCRVCESGNVFVASDLLLPRCFWPVESSNKEENAEKEGRG